MRFPATGRDLFAERQREALLLECDAALSDEPGKHTAALADIRRVLVQMLCPPVLRAGEAGNAVLALERTFEGQVVELETHCNVVHPEGLSVFSFFARVDYFEAMMRAKAAVQ